ncbi:hypothetical protein B296_00012581, partial [Ensete ventricosum]
LKKAPKDSLPYSYIYVFLVHRSVQPRTNMARVVAVFVTTVTGNSLFHSPSLGNPLHGVYGCCGSLHLRSQQQEAQTNGNNAVYYGGSGSYASASTDVKRHKYRSQWRWLRGLRE